MGRKIKLVILGGLILAGLLGFCRSEKSLAMIKWEAEPFSKSCAKFEIVFARGSGQQLDDQDFRAFSQAIREEMREKSVSFRVYELGTDNFSESYPAIKVDFWQGVKMLNRKTSQSFWDSVESGAWELILRVREVTKRCPGSKFLLAGYSQGALVMARAIEELGGKDIGFLAMVGDPKLYLPEGAGTWPPACFGKDLSFYRYFAPDCRAFQGILGARKPYALDQMRGKIGLWCNFKDIICSKSGDLDDLMRGHTSYVNRGIYKQIAKVLTEKTGAKINSKNLRNVGILIDSTASMSGKIAKYREEARKMAKQVIEAGGKVALAEYKDLASDGFKTKLWCDFSCRLADFEAGLGKIKVSGGGDRPESALSGLMDMMSQLKWQQGANKSILVLTDAPFKNPEVNGINLDKVVKKSLEIDPVNVYVLAQSELEKDFKELTERTGGKFFDINGGGVELSSKYMLERPVANLPLEEYLVKVGEEVVFDGRKSAIESGGELEYQWDLDFDGKFEITELTGLVKQSYTKAGEGFIQLKVVDLAGRASTMSAKVRILEDQTGPEAKLENLRIAKDGTRRKISWQSQETALVMVALDGAPMGATREHELILEVRPGEKLLLQLVPINQLGQRGQEVDLRIEEESSGQLGRSGGQDAGRSMRRNKGRNEKSQKFSALGNLKLKTFKLKTPDTGETGARGETSEKSRVSEKNEDDENGEVDKIFDWQDANGCHTRICRRSVSDRGVDILERQRLARRLLWFHSKPCELRRPNSAWGSEVDICGDVSYFKINFND